MGLGIGQSENPENLEKTFGEVISSVTICQNSCDNFSSFEVYEGWKDMKSSFQVYNSENKNFLIFFS